MQALDVIGDTLICPCQTVQSEDLSRSMAKYESSHSSKKAALIDYTIVRQNLGVEIDKTGN